MELIAGSFVLVVLCLCGNIGFAIASRLQRSKPVIEA
jgi:hypothetical protein